MLLVKHGVIIFEEIEAHDVEVEALQCQNSIITMASGPIIDYVILHRNEIVLATHHEMNVGEGLHLRAGIALANWNLTVGAVEVWVELIDYVYETSSYIVWEEDEWCSAVNKYIVVRDFEIRVHFGFIFSGIPWCNHFDAFEWNEPHCCGPRI